MKNIRRQNDSIEPKRYISATSDSFLLDLFLYCFCNFAKSWNGKPFFVSFVSAFSFESVPLVSLLSFSVVVSHLTGLCSIVVNETILSIYMYLYTNIICADKNFKKLISFSTFFHFYFTSASIYPDHIYECKSFSC